MEALFSQSNIQDILHRSIRQEFDGLFLNWALRAYLVIDEWLMGEYYASKNARLAVLRSHIDENGLDRILTAIIASVIRTKDDQTIQQVLGYLEKYMPHDDIWDRLKTSGELLALLSGPNRFYYITRIGRADSPMVHCRFWKQIDAKFGDILEWVSDTHFNPPLVEPPKKVKNTHNAGYHTVKVPVLLGKETHHNHNVDYKTLNYLNSIPWKIDGYVRTHEEVHPNKSEDPKDIAMNERFIKQSTRIYDALGSDRFWLVWQYDSRGRIYSHGYHVNMQSYEYKKAMLNFGPKRACTT
jgi:hypothetical protein